MGEVIVITSGKGGVGKSSITAGIGTELARLGKKTVLFDADVALRSLDIILGTAEKTVYNWLDLATNNCELSQAAIATEDISNLYVISAPASRCAIKIEEFCKMFDRLKEEFDYIIIDSPAGIGQGFELSVIPADLALVVATTDPVCLRAANAAIKILINKGIAKRRLIINRFKPKPIGKKKLPNVDDTIDGVGARLLGVVPEDERITYYAVKGKPLEPNFPSALAFKRIARRLLGEEIPLKRLERM